MNQEILLIDQDAKQIIFQNYRYQKNVKKSNLYRCCNRMCNVIFNPDTLKINRSEHYHPGLSNCEIDCLLHFKQVIQVISNNHDIPLSDAYNAEYQKLILKYSYKEQAEHFVVVHV